MAALQNAIVAPWDSA